MKLGKREEADSADATFELHPDGAIGVPMDMEYERQVGHIKLTKVFNFFGHGEAKYLFLVWLCIANLVMPVHYSLFKSGTWFQNRRPEAKQKISDLIDGSRGSPVKTCLGSLAEILLDSRGRGRRHLRILSLKLGDQTHLWPPRVLQALHVATTVVFCIMWRELFFYYDCYPWVLAPLFNTGLPMEERRAAWAGLLGNMQNCCLDAGLTHPLLLNFLPHMETLSL